MPAFSLGNNAPARRADILAIGAIAVYCIAYAAVRLLVSSSMELSEAEQFLDSAVFSFGYNQQAPLYSWIVFVMSSLFGMNIVTLTVVKYSVIFFFYFSFFLLAREFWDPRKALLVTGSLLIIPTFSFEVHRDLTHTMLLTGMATVMCYFYIRILREARTRDYVLMGIAAGLGILSKYNFGFFLTALFLAGLTGRESRSVILDKRIFLSLVCAVLVLLPHAVWLVQGNFMPIQYTLSRARAGNMSLDTPGRILHVIWVTYLEVLLFMGVLSVFFFRQIRAKKNLGDRYAGLFRWLAVYGLVIPLLAIFFLRAGNFSCRWLAPIDIALPLAFFSLIGVDFEKRAFRLFGGLCIFIAVALLSAKIFIGFFPDSAGKVERSHIPYQALSVQLGDRLRENGLGGIRNFPVVASEDDYYIAANLIAWMPEAKFIPLQKVVNDTALQRTIGESGGLFVGDIQKHGMSAPQQFSSAFPTAQPLISLSSRYLHSVKFPPYQLGVIILPKHPAEPRSQL